MSATLAGSYRQYFDSRFLAADDLPAGKEVKVSITDVTRESVKGDGKRPDHPVIALHFKGKNKMLTLNKTNAKLIRKVRRCCDAPGAASTGTVPLTAHCEILKLRWAMTTKDTE